MVSQALIVLPGRGRGVEKAMISSRETGNPGAWNEKLHLIACGASVSSSVKWGLQVSSCRVVGGDEMGWKDFPGGPVVRILLPMQGTQVRPSVWEVSTRPRACVSQLPNPHIVQPVLCNERSHCNEKPAHHEEE